MTATSTYLFRLMTDHRASSATSRALFAAWVVARLVAFTLLVRQPLEQALVSDTNLYAAYVAQFFGDRSSSGIRLSEYPGPARLLLLTVGAISGHMFQTAFVLLAVLVDCLFMLSLHRARVREPEMTSAVGPWLWAIGPPLLGATSWTRLDIFVSAMSGWSVLMVRRHPGRTASLLTLAGLLKLWPLVALPVAVSRIRPRHMLILAATALGICWASVAILGPRSLWSALDWHAHRGTQVESVLALSYLLHSSHADAIVFRFGAYEVPANGTLTLILSLVGGLTALGVSLVTTALARRRDLGQAPLATCLLFCTALLMVSGKVASPQYVLWLTAPCASALCLRAIGRPRLATGCVMLNCLAAHLTYPYLYPSLMTGAPSGVVVLLIRHSTLALLAGLFAVDWFRALDLGIYRRKTSTSGSTRIFNSRMSEPIEGTDCA